MLDTLFETNIDSDRNGFETGTGFAAGTLVHTKEGLVPIEQIKVGDWVLSKPEIGEGEQAYKRVLQTFAHEPRDILEIRYSPLSDINRSQARGILTTVDHPFWVAGQGWTAAKNLVTSFTNDDRIKLELANGEQVYFFGKSRHYVSDRLGVSWLPSRQQSTYFPGALFDHINGKIFATDVMPIEEVQHGELADPYFKLPVYNLAVEDFHTYYVGEAGVWVHNQNCGSLRK